MRKLILLLFFSQYTPLLLSALFGHLEVARLLVESKADVAARTRCFSPPPSHHLSLTICLAAMVAVHSNLPKTKTIPMLLHTCAASALLNDAPLRAATAQIKTVLLRVAAAVWGMAKPLLLRSSRSSGASSIHTTHFVPKRNSKRASSCDLFSNTFALSWCVHRPSCIITPTAQDHETSSCFDTQPAKLAGAGSGNSSPRKYAARFFLKYLHTRVRRQARQQQHYNGSHQGCALEPSRPARFVGGLFLTRVLHDKTSVLIIA